MWKIFHTIMSVPQNIIMGLNNVICLVWYILNPNISTMKNDHGCLNNYGDEMHKSLALEITINGLDAQCIDE